MNHHANSERQMRRAVCILTSSLPVWLAACGETPAKAGGQQHAGTSSGGVAGTSTAGSAMAGSAMAGSAGAPMTGGGGHAGSPTGGAGLGGGGAAGSGGAAGASGACAPPALICDDFEKYADGASDLGPDWITYTYSGTVKVDASKPRAGQRSLHLNTDAGMRHYAELMRETRGQELLPKRHFGRLMLWLSSVPPQAHWNVNAAIGPLTGFPEEVAKYAEGGMFGKLMSNYAQRGRVMVDGEYPLRGIGPEQGDPGADADCAVAAPAQTVEAGKWLCWEWEFDGSTDTARLWVDGEAMDEIDAVGTGKQCQGPGFNGKPMSASYRWESPTVWDKLIIGYEQYQDTPAQELWIDDVVISTERAGCPMP